MVSEYLRDRAGHRGIPRRLGADRLPRPREELLDLAPLDRVLAQLDALGLNYQKNDSGYAARCPHHLSDVDRLNFEVVELDNDRYSANGRMMPTGSVLLYCQAYGDLTGPDACSQSNVISALGLWPSDLYPGVGDRRRDDLRDGRRSSLDSAFPSRTPPTDEEIEAWEEKCASYAAAVIAEHGLPMEDLAVRLGVPAGALARFGVGWRCPDYRRVGEATVVGRCWTLPERDALGRITAINRRYEDGEKRVMRGGRRGLYIPDGWRDLPGPIYCPEGFSDAAALVGAGRCAIGRPNVGGGVELLAGLLRGDPRPIVILGENDDRWAGPEGRPAWRRPGYDGAVAACTRLRKALLRMDITAALPPEGFKDIRAYINGKGGLS